MALTSNDKQSAKHPHTSDRAANENLRPFDSRELEKLPLATEDDPPYRPWWVIERS